MHEQKEKAAAEAGTFGSGKEKIYKLSIVPRKEKVKSVKLCGHFTMDEDGNALLYGASVGAMIGEMLRHERNACIEIRIWGKENA